MWAGVGGSGLAYFFVGKLQLANEVLILLTLARLIVFTVYSIVGLVAFVAWISCKTAVQALFIDD